MKNIVLRWIVEWCSAAAIVFALLILSALADQPDPLIELARAAADVFAR